MTRSTPSLAPDLAGKPGLLVLHPLTLPLLRGLSGEFNLYDATAVADRRDFLRRIPVGEVRAIASIGRDGCNAELFDLLPGLQIVCAVGAGVEGIDLAAAEARGIVVTNAGTGNSRDVADHAIALWLAARNRIGAGQAWIMEDRWRTEGLLPSRRSLSSERIGIVGLGNIGRTVASRAAGFGAEVAWWGPRAKPGESLPRYPSLLDLANWATTLIVAARGGDDSRGLIDDRVLAALGPEGLLVNVARGFMVDEDALISRLRSGALGGAALDVFVEEPAGPDRWLGVPNLVITPHSAALTNEARDQLVSSFHHNLRTVITGKAPLNVVSRTAVQPGV